MSTGIRIVFDGPPGPMGGRFVEAETYDGKSVKVGRWEQGQDGYWYLYLDAMPVPEDQPEEKEPV